MTGDGLTDLVTAIQHDLNTYEPDDDVMPRLSDADPEVPWPECFDVPACLAPPEQCINDATYFCNGQGTGDRCGFLHDQMQACIDDADPVPCFHPMRCGDSDGASGDPDCDTAGLRAAADPARALRPLSVDDLREPGQWSARR